MKRLLLQMCSRIPNVDNAYLQRSSSSAFQCSVVPAVTRVYKCISFSTAIENVHLSHATDVDFIASIC